MIKISSKTYKPTSGTGPFTYQWNSTNTCVYFDKPTGTVISGTTFTTDIFVTDLTCFNFGVSSVNLTLIDAYGCETIHTFYPNNPCDDLGLTAIGQGPNDLDFSITAFGGSGNYQFDWTVSPAGVFQISSNSVYGTTTQFIHLTPITQSPKLPQYFDVSCTVTDYNGCKSSVTSRFPMSSVLLANIIVESSCIESGNKIPKGFSIFQPAPTTKGFQAGPILLKAQSSYPGCDPDWSTVSFALPDIDIQYTIDTNPYAVTFYGIKKTLFKNGVLNIPFTVLDCKGAISNEAYISILEGTCSDGTNPCPLIINNLCITNCDSVFTINLEDLIKSPDCCSTNSIDWTTFDILPGGPINPATVVYNAGNHTLTYTANGSTEIADLIRWSISDALGNHSGIKTIQIARLCPQAPACTDDCYYVSQNAINHPLNVLTNDLGPNLKTNTLIISQIPTHGTAYVFDGDIYYTPFNTYEGVDILKYKIFNYDGLSCEATVTLNIAASGPAGTGNNIITCTSEVPVFAEIDIPSQVSDAGEFNLTLIAYTGDHDELLDGDEIDIAIIVSGTEIASATLIIGQDYTTLAGVKVGTDDEWLTGTNFAQYLTPAVLNKTTLVTGQTIIFNKHDWAWATNNVNKYTDDLHIITPQTNAKEVTVKIKSRSLINSAESMFVSDIVEKVKIFAFEDTSHDTIIDGILTHGNNAGAWESYIVNGNGCIPNDCTSCGGTLGCVTCDYHGGATHLYSWYSQNLSCAPYNGAKKVIEYKLVGAPLEVGLTNAFTNEGQLPVAIDNAIIVNNPSFTTFGLVYRSWNYWTTGTKNYNLWGNQATYLNSHYLVVSEPELEYFVISYDGNDAMGNPNTEAKCTTVSHILF